MKEQQMDAYRYFFPAGWMMGVWGVLLWILFPWNLVAYPGIRHPEIMSGGFFLLFVSGFLMTAAPKFTSSFDPTKRDQQISFLLIAALFLSLLSEKRIYFFAVVVSLFIFLIYFLVRRFFRRKTNPPDSFLFVGFGMAAGLLGSVGMLLGESFNVPGDLYSLSRLALLQAYVLCLVLGVGSRLIPALLGWAPLPTEGGKIKPRLPLFSMLAVLFLASFVLEAFHIQLLSQLLRSLVISFIAFFFWKLHRFPQRKAFQSWWLWVSAWSLLLGQWGICFFPDTRIHLLHVVLVSGLGLMTLMIASRVILSHGHHGLEWEKNSKGLFLGALLLSLAGFTRLSAGFAPHIYQSHLLYAAYTWIFGLLLWGAMFLPKIFRIKEA